MRVNESEVRRRVSIEKNEKRYGNACFEDIPLHWIEASDCVSNTIPVVSFGRFENTLKIVRNQSDLDVFEKNTCKEALKKNDRFVSRLQSMDR